MKNQSYTRLSNGVEMPLLGLGVFDMYEQEAVRAVSDALEIGYRLIDTASLYGNEKEVGQAVRASGISRQEIFITTKVGNQDHGYDASLRAFDTSLRNLQLDYVDLYLVHWPVKGKRRKTWQALEKLYADGRVRAIGVANYLLPFLEELSGYSAITPMVNQVEYTPWLTNQDLLAHCRQSSIQLQSYSPITRGVKLSDPRLLRVCEKYGKSPAQVVLRWNLDQGISTIPKSASKKRLEENFSIFDFALSEEDIRFMNGFDEGFRICDNPMDFW